MRMSADKKFGRTCHQTADDGRIVFPRITADMFNQYFCTIYRETVYLRIQLSDFLSVNISIYRPEWTEGG